MLQNREQRNRMILGVLIIALGVMTLVNNAIADDVAEWIWIIGLAAAALVFGWAYTFDKETWAAVGAYVTGAIAILIVLAAKVDLPEIWVAIIVMLEIALPFFAAWWANPKKWGFLIPAYVFVAIIPILLISEGTTEDDNLITAYVMLAIGVPFIFAYFVTRKWGLLIPGGIMSFIALAFVGISIGLSEQVLTVIVPLAVIAVGVFMLYSAWSGKNQEQKQR
jgi:hypothetical protein